MAVHGGIKNLDKLKKKITGIEGAANAAIKNTISDARARAPGWIAQGMVNRYAVKKSDIKKLGTVRTNCPDRHTLQLIYSGRPLTPARFKISPRSPKNGAYTLATEIIRGEKKTLGKVKKLTKKQRAALGKNFRREGTRTSDHSPIMLMHTGNQKEGGINYIPFQRVSTDRKDIEAKKTIALPQMVTESKNGDMHPEVWEQVEAGLQKRLNHHMKLVERELQLSGKK